MGLALQSSIFQKQFRALLVVPSSLLYAVSLDYSLSILADVFAHEEYVYIVNLNRAVFSYGLVLLTSYAMQQLSEKKITGLFSVVLYCMLVVPCIVYFMRSNMDYRYVCIISFAYLWFLFFSKMISGLPLKLSFSSKSIFYGTVFAATTLTHVIAISRFGIHFNLDLTGVYAVREYYLASLGMFLGYLMVWQGYVVNPLLLVLAFRKRRYFAVFFVILSQFYLFSITGYKTFLFAFLFVIFIVTSYHRLKLYLPLLFAGGVLISIMIYVSYENVWPLSLFVRRSLFSPGQITYHYLDFFSRNDFVFLSDSIFSHIVRYPYEMDPPRLIGWLHYGGEDSANTGLIGNAFMQFGVVGVVVFVSIFSFVLFLFDRIMACKYRNSELIVASVAMSVFSIMNSGLFTVMLTHGLLLSLMLALFMPMNEI